MWLVLVLLMMMVPETCGSVAKVVQLVSGPRVSAGCMESWFLSALKCRGLILNP